MLYGYDRCGDEPGRAPAARLAAFLLVLRQHVVNIYVYAVVRPSLRQHGYKRLWYPETLIPALVVPSCQCLYRLLVGCSRTGGHNCLRRNLCVRTGNARHRVYAMVGEDGIRAPGVG
ncbi:MAG: hypothetical protein IJ887_05550 [Prevotella sp.]|nr:hypothetical protein [Prevotella sp.]MBR6187822.1 hypothetical protein [Prevotella sp.]